MLLYILVIPPNSKGVLKTPASRHLAPDLLCLFPGTYRTYYINANGLLNNSLREQPAAVSLSMTGNLWRTSHGTSEKVQFSLVLVFSELKQNTVINLFRHWLCAARAGTVSATQEISVHAKKHAGVLIAWTHDLEHCNSCPSYCFLPCFLSCTAH